MNAARLVEVIETYLERRGDGTERSPVRLVRQYWTRDGELLAEVDSLAVILTPEKLAEVRQVITKTMGMTEAAAQLGDLVAATLDHGRDEGRAGNA